ncbi:hypothetical protein Ahy_B04g073583 [Arachis hypogaea]|uniref:Aminotransferase-like plant mobile domain-containing protein n=1 Tax=Arachis hypogaea TaxID=3818 RepID=A0A444ZQV4_ARAHY|nr:hypothetical protein Ahy_B04g073583 [Arachis hypogaea]
MTWLRERVRQMPSDTTNPDTLQQYARCYIMLMIEGYLLTDKSNNTVHLRWLPLLDDFERCRSLSWGSIVLAWTYHSLCHAAHCHIIDIAGLIGLEQQTRDHHQQRVLRWRRDLDRVLWDEGGYPHIRVGLYQREDDTADDAVVQLSVVLRNGES